MKATVTTKRAPKGGAMGANGEWYEGGKFINSIPENSKKEGSGPKAKPRKVQYEPFKWVVSDRTPIMSMVGTRAQWINRYKPEAGIMPFAPGIAYASNEVNGKTVAEWCEAYNAGERWM